ncbi:Nramp-domain-containing protein [Gonapodya prolifera JEL478]|uniref:Nramp-domain-containing protein n=1 Tax=Gonapodya prolifera (strain JEL478) TaxID=1344416 RepID=A0A139ANX3_GONPJ|nr:Nramp-domain-containing protein [Gonapodya prolifera JEL478]|eukprot:KXS18203.1 Nramp-domain-containing protein [Gonapodya prolifera JEL478]
MPAPEARSPSDTPRASGDSTFAGSDVHESSTFTLPTSAAPQSRRLLSNTGVSVVSTNATSLQAPIPLEHHHKTPTLPESPPTIVLLPTSLETEEPSAVRKTYLRIKTYLQTLLRYVGPGFMIAVGYMDPGNWATDLAAGSAFNYSLLHIVLLSNLMAVLLQSLAVKLGVATDRDLAANCRANFPKWINIPLWLLAEGAIVATDLAEVIGTAIALNLLFQVPLLWGVLVTGLDVLIILLGWQEGTLRFFEAGVGFLVLGVGVCFSVLLANSRPNFGDLMRGFIPTPGLFTEPGMLYLAMGIIGATVMPHNLYLHSNIVLHRRREAETLAKVEEEKEREDKQKPSQLDGASITQRIGAFTASHRSEGHTGGEHDGFVSVAMTPTSNKKPRLTSDAELRKDEKGETERVVKGAAMHDTRRIFHRHGTTAEASSGDVTVEVVPTGDAQIRSESESAPGSSAHGDLDLRRTTVSLDSAGGSGFEPDPMSHLPTTLHFTILDAVLALTFALFVNAAILSVSAATFFSHGTQVGELADAYRLMVNSLGATAGTLFALALLFAGQSSTITGTLAGQVVMEGFLGPAAVGKVAPWVRRLITRGCAIIPAAIVCVVRGESGVNDLLVGSQVALSVQLPFAVWPLVWFTAKGSVMGVRRRRKEGYKELADGDPEAEDGAGGVEHEHEVDLRFVNSWWVTALAVLVAALLTGLNVWLLAQVALGRT